MIVELARLVPFAGLGALLGLLYFGGLWLTVQRMDRQPRPLLWLLASGGLRLALLLAGLYLATRGEAAPLLACLVGLLAVRTCLLRGARTGRPAASPGP